MSYYQPRNGGRGRTHTRAPREYTKADPYYPPSQGPDNYRSGSPPRPIDDRYGPPRARGGSPSPGEYRDARAFYDRHDSSAYSSRDHGRQWSRSAADYPVAARVPEDGRRWDYLDPPLRERDAPPPRDWQPRGGDRDRDRIYDRPREYSSHDDRYGERNRGYGGTYERPPPPPPNARRESPPRRNALPNRRDTGWRPRRPPSPSRSDRSRRSPIRSSPRRRSRSRSRSPGISPSRSPRTSMAGNHSRMRAPGAVASFPPKNEDDLRRSSYPSTESKPAAPDRMDVDPPQPAPSQARPPSPSPPRAPASPVQSTKFKAPPTGPAAQQRYASATLQQGKESRTWIPGPRAAQAQQQQLQKDTSLKGEKEKEQEQERGKGQEKEDKKPFDPTDIQAKPRVRSEAEMKIGECMERLRTLDEKVLANKVVIAKARFDLLCAQMDHEYASFRAQVAQRQRIHLEKGLPMEAFDELEREGVFGPLTSKA